jgi:hypothetical protein
MQIKSDNVSRFAFKLRVITGHVALQLVRFQSRPMPDPLHGILADPQLCGEFAARPVRRSLLWFATYRIQDLGP